VRAEIKIRREGKIVYVQCKGNFNHPDIVNYNVNGITLFYEYQYPLEFKLDSVGNSKKFFTDIKKAAYYYKKKLKELKNEQAAQ
jgi:hypothetical protein